MNKDKFFNQKNILPIKDEKEDLLEKLFKFKGNKSELLSEITKQKEYVKQLKQSILQKAIQGKLTEDWRTKNSPPLEGWLRFIGDGVVNDHSWNQTQSDGVVKSTTHLNKAMNKRNTKNYMKLPYNPKLKQRAKELRKAGNLSEVLFWNQVKNKRFLGFDFDRQKIIGNYIVDFYCSNNNVVIEIDGSSHNDKQEYDTNRDSYLKKLGLEIIHIKDFDVKRNINGVFEYLKNHKAFKNFPVPQDGLQDITTTPSLRDTSRDETTTPSLWDTPPKEGNWESASELLKRIKAEKEKLIKEKKIRKEKPLPPITKEEIPFELPIGWVWCRLGEVSIINGGYAFKSSQYTEQGVRVIRISDFDYNGFKNKSIVKYPFDEKLNSYLLEENTILMAMTGSTVGKTYLVKLINEKMYVNQRVATIKIIQPIISEYIDFVFKTNIVQKVIKNVKNSTNDNISMTDIKKFFIPLPPLAEQKAIVEKVESLMQKVAAMEKEIEKSEQNAKKLMQAVLKEAFKNKKE